MIELTPTELTAILLSLRVATVATHEIASETLATCVTIGRRPFEAEERALVVDGEDVTIALRRIDTAGQG